MTLCVVFEQRARRLYTAAPPTHSTFADVQFRAPEPPRSHTRETSRRSTARLNPSQGHRRHNNRAAVAAAPSDACMHFQQSVTGFPNSQRRALHAVCYLHSQQTLLLNFRPPLCALIRSALGSIKGVFIVGGEEISLVAGGDLLQQHTSYYRLQPYDYD